MTRIILVALLMVAACKADPEPAWGLDPMYIEPVGDEEIIGFQTWEFFGDRWKKKHAGKHFVCAAVIEFTGTPTTASCPKCTHAWKIESTLLESDCPNALATDPLVLSLRRIGLTETLSAEDAPHAKTSEGWADYGYGWELHGWAYPDTFDNGGSSNATSWDASEPYALWPTAAWPL